MRRILLILLSACLVACASTPKPAPLFRALPESVRAELKSPEILFGMQALEVGTENYASLPLKRSGEFADAVFGGKDSRGGLNVRRVEDIVLVLAVGLLAATSGLVYGTGEAGVEGYQQLMANLAIAPVQRSMSGVDFGERLREALDRQGNTQLLFKDGRLSFVTPPTAKNFEAYHALSLHDTTLIINTRYAMTTDLNTLVLTADASLIPRTDAMWRLQYEHFRKGQRMDRLPGQLQTDPLHALYRRVMRYEIKLPAKETDRSKAAAAWVASDAALLRSAFDEGLGVIARLLAADLSGKAAGTSLDMDDKRFVLTPGKDDLLVISRR